MFRMENPNLEETRPINLSPETEPNQNLEQTQAQPTVRQAQPETTQPESASESGYATTAPVPVRAAASNPSPVQPASEPATAVELDATMPVSLKTSAAQPVEPTPTVPPLDQPPSIPPPPARRAVALSGRRKGLPWFFFPILGLAILIAILLLSGFGGYAAGIGERKSAEKTQVSQVLQEQYQLGLQDMQAEQYSRARQRFEYIIQLDPNYPGVTDKLAEVLLEISTTATPTLLPPPTVIPTTDSRDKQQQFDLAQQDLAASDWTQAIDDLLKLRKADPAFRTVEIDGMLFLALRNSGCDKILKSADLEGGIYDLTLAEKFGPLDSEAEGLLSWSSLYITGASFWDIDWEQVVNYFSQVAPQLPNLRDGSGMTANERLRLGLFEYGNALANKGQYCKAVKAYQDSLAIAPDAKVQAAGELAAKGCSGGDQPVATPKPGKKPKPTPQP
jgi:tetratricopeptide (TPR) repeat protein